MLGCVNEACNKEIPLCEIPLGGVVILKSALFQLVPIHLQQGLASYDLYR